MYPCTSALCVGMIKRMRRILRATVGVMVMEIGWSPTSLVNGDQWLIAMEKGDMMVYHQWFKSKVGQRTRISPWFQVLYHFSVFEVLLLLSVLEGSHQYRNGISKSCWDLKVASFPSLQFAKRHVFLTDWFKAFSSSRKLQLGRSEKGRKAFGFDSAFPLTAFKKEGRPAGEWFYTECLVTSESWVLRWILNPNAKLHLLTVLEAETNGALTTAIIRGASNHSLEAALAESISRVITWLVARMRPSKRGAMRKCALLRMPSEWSQDKVPVSHGSHGNGTIVVGFHVSLYRLSLPR